MLCVTMVDKYMSGWGPAAGKTNIFLVHCDTPEQAEQIKKAAQERAEMAKIRIHHADRTPYYNPASYIVTERNFSDLGPAWTGENV